MLHPLFNPKAVAVVGASSKELNIGNRIIRNLIEFGFTGAVYPINAKVDHVRGVKAYPSILDVPGEVDVVHLPIPAVSVPQVIDECGRKGVKFVILNGGGFTETGPAGAAIEEECIAKARRYGMRIFGPNCQGVINTAAESRTYCNFTFTRPHPGVVSLVALSGGVAELLHQALHRMGVGTRMYASNGNACDVSIPEILRYYGEDAGTKVIVLYVEGLREPTAFLQAARAVAQQKPILAMKAGRTEAGAEAAATHTGGLAKKDMTTDLIFEKAGVLGFHDEEELCQAAAVFTCQPVPKGANVGVITNTGGPSVIATDVLVSNGLNIPVLSAESRAALKERLLKEVTVRNPLDVLATANGEHFRAALDVMLDDDDIDSIFISMVTPFFVDNESIARHIVEANGQRRKPIVCTLMTDKLGCAETVRILKEGEVPCYDFPTAAAKALGALCRYGEIRRRMQGEVRVFDDVDRQRVRAVIEGAKRGGRERLFMGEAFDVLSAYGIPVARWRAAASPGEAADAAAEIGFPVVLKVDSPRVVHKSDAGGVILNLKDAAAVKRAAERLAAGATDPDMRIVVQAYVPGGREVIVGARSEGDAGHLLMCGAGGVFVEIMRDVAFRLSPVTDVEATEMLAGLKAMPLFDGARGQKAIDKKALIDCILRTSRLVEDLPAIKEMDLNPVMAFHDGLLAVDARISL
jgi:acetyltransferase